MLKHSSMALLIAATVVLAGCPKGGAEKPAATEGEHTEAHGEEAGHAEGEAGHTEGDSHEEGEHEHGHNENVVEMHLETQRRAGLKTVAVANRPVEAYLTTTGEFTGNRDREAHVTTRTTGRVIKLGKTVGDAVKAGTMLAMLESTELGRTQSSYLEALARYDLASQTAERQRRLFRSDLIARKEVIAAENALQLARIELDDVGNQLTLLGMTRDRIALLARKRQLDPTVPLLSPIGGVVLAKHVTLGEMIRPEAEEPAFTITDISKLWVNASLYERDIARVHEGQRATVTTPAYPGRTFDGRVQLVSTGLDEQSRTAKARIVVNNPDLRLKPEMFANIQIAMGSRPTLAVPSSAVMQDKGETFAFVKKDETTFERKPVKVGAPVGGFVPVESGLSAGEEVVSSGAFTLKSELMKESFGEHEH